MAIAPALALYQAADQAVLDLLSDPAASKSFQGRSYTNQNISVLKKIRDDLKSECQSTGLLPVDYRNSKIGVSQLQVYNPTAFLR